MEDKTREVNNIKANFIPTQDKKIKFLHIEKISNLDYGHFLQFHQGKCHMLHQHSSWVDLDVYGYQKGEWVVDFGILKQKTKEVINLIDHKFIVKDSYIKEEKDGNLEIEYIANDKIHKMLLPKEEVCVICNEPTVENLTELLAQKLLDELPENVTGLVFYLSEGVQGSCGVFVDRQPRELEELGKIIRYHLKYDE